MAASFISSQWHDVACSTRNEPGAARIAPRTAIVRLSPIAVLRANTWSVSVDKSSVSTGKSLPIFGNRVKPRNKKYFALSRNPNQGISLAIPSRPEGRIMIATIVGRVRWTLAVPMSERHESVRQRRVVLTPRCWRQCTWRQLLSGRYGGKRAVLRGDHVISRKAIAQGMSDVLRCPVCSCAHFFYPLHMRPRVQRASGIPCAL